ncbi:MAG: hypothetical protein R3B82_19335 [Sandaracinaceae bacterium]
MATSTAQQQRPNQQQSSNGENLLNNNNKQRRRRCPALVVGGVGVGVGDRVSARQQQRGALRVLTWHHSFGASRAEAELLLTIARRPSAIRASLQNPARSPRFNSTRDATS